MHQSSAFHLRSVISRRRWLVRLGSSFLLSPCQASPSQSPPKATVLAIQRGVAWLLDQQAVDGGWHSQVYGNLRDGVGITALALKTLAGVSPHVDERFTQFVQPALARGVTFLTANTDEHGLVSGPQKLGDNPVYATSLLLDALLVVPQSAADRQTTQRLLAALQRAQFGPANHCSQTAFEFGGWGPQFPLKGIKLPGDAANISVTSYALRTLRRYERLDEVTAKRAAVFLNRCRAGQGYAFVPDPQSPLNKLGTEQTADGTMQANGYTSATCDACLAWQTLGSEFDEPYQAALAAYAELPLPGLWTDDHARPSRKIASQAGLYFYHAARLAELWQATRVPAIEPRILRITEQLVTHQQANGSWRNSVDTMREDDPLIATSFAMLSLLS